MRRTTRLKHAESARAGRWYLRFRTPNNTLPGSSSLSKDCGSRRLSVSMRQLRTQSPMPWAYWKFRCGILVYYRLLLPLLILTMVIIVWKAGLYVCIVDLGTRMHGEAGMKDPVSQDLESSAVSRPWQGWPFISSEKLPEYRITWPRGT